jgi:hypothetical protein
MDRGTSRILTFGLIALTVMAVRARAETFELANGGKLSGELLNPDETPRKAYSIRLEEGAVVSLAVGQVARVAEKSAAELWYDEALKGLTNDVEGHLNIAAQCKSKRLDAQRMFHLEEVLKVDPENVVARRELGYSKLDGEWIKIDVWHRQRGYVKHKGNWALPQEVAIAAREEEQNSKFKEWNELVRRWRSWVTRGRDRAEEGMQRIREINEPAAATVLAKLLDEKNELPALKLAYIEVLGRLPGATSSIALVRRSLNDPDLRMREKSLDQLAQRHDKFALRLYIQILNRAADTNTEGPENLLVNLAAIGLAKLHDDSATLPLIEALVTRHKFPKPKAAGLSPVFNNGPGGGGGGLGIGGRQEIELRDLRNQNVRDALISLHPGMNLGFDEVAWKHWYEQQHTPNVVNLRRELD